MTAARMTGDVDAFLAALDHPRKAEIEALRAVILAASPAITEHIKWNAPSFGPEGEDRVTMRLHPGARLQLVFHRGTKPGTGDFLFEDASGLIEWAAPDRGLVTIKDRAELDARAGAIAGLVRDWIEATSAPA